MVKNRRQFSRFPLDADTTLHQGEQVWPVQLVDISLKGALVKVLDNLPDNPAGLFEITARLTDQESAIVMSLHLAHQEGQYLGFTCDYIDIDSASHLKRLVELNLGEPELLQRELNALVLASSASQPSAG